MATTTPENANVTYKQQIAAILYPISAAETSEGITPTDYKYPVGNVLRYGADPTTKTVNSTASFQNAVDVIFASGGGTVVIPSGEYGIETVTIDRDSSTTITLNLQGDGMRSTFLWKYGAGTTPVFDFTNTFGTIVAMYSSFSNFYVIGNSKTHNAFDITMLSNFYFNNVGVQSCDVAINGQGALIWSAYECRFNSNNIGYVGRYISTTDNAASNNVKFHGCIFSFNTSWGIDFGGGHGLSLYGCDIESNGTGVVSTTGAMVIRDTVDDESSFAVININGTWFEANNGADVSVEAATELHLIFSSCCFFSTLVTVGAIRSLTLDSIITNGTVTTGADSTIVNGGDITTYVDNSITSSSVTGAVIDGYSEAITKTNGSRSTVETLITAGNVTYIDSGKTFILDLAAGFAVGLPWPRKGLKYTFINSTTTHTGDYVIYTTSSGNILNGLVMEPTPVSVTGYDEIDFVGGTSVPGDRLTIECDGTDYYFVGMSSVTGGVLPVSNS
jgi:hypothetical protein